MWLTEKLKGIMDMPADEENGDGDSARSDGGPMSQEGKRTKDGRQCGKVVNINTTANLQVYVMKPDQFTDASSIADLLKDMRTIVLNLETTNRDVAHRILDFLGGVAYAYNGQIEQIANNTFLIAPYNVELMGNLLDDLQSSEWDMPEDGDVEQDAPRP